MTTPPLKPDVFGIDVCKQRLDLAWADGTVPEPLPYDAHGLASLLQRLKDRPPTLVVIESTGGIERDLIDTLLDASIPVTRVEPRRVRRFAEAEGHFAKTDALDALILARFGERMNVRLMEKQQENRVELDALVTCRKQLLLVKTEQSNRRRLVRSKPALKAIDAVTKTLDKQVDTLDRQIKKIIDSDDQFRDDDRIIQSIPGVAIGTSAIILASFRELGQCHKNKAAALVGVAPYDKQSGSRDRPRHIHGGRKDVRNVFYMAACACAKFNPVIKAFADHLTANNKPFKVVITACIRKLIGYLSTMLSQRLTWDQLNVVKNFKPS